MWVRGGCERPLPPVTGASNNDVEEDLRHVSAPNGVAHEFDDDLSTTAGRGLRGSVDSTNTNNSLYMG